MSCYQSLCHLAIICSVCESITREAGVDGAFGAPAERVRSDESSPWYLKFYDLVLKRLHVGHRPVRLELCEARRLGGGQRSFLVGQRTTY